MEYGYVRRPVFLSDFSFPAAAHYENESKRRAHTPCMTSLALRCVQSANDAWFEQKWRRVYSGEHIRELQWRISLGNHDYNPTRDRPGPNDGGNEMFQVCTLQAAACGADRQGLIMISESSKLRSQVTI